VFRRRRFFNGKPVHTADEIGDIAWLTRDGLEMTDGDWYSGFKSVTVFLNGAAIREPSHLGERVVDDSFLLCFNAHLAEIPVAMPGESYARQWTAALDTSAPDGFSDRVLGAGETFTLPGRSVLVWRKTG